MLLLLTKQQTDAVAPSRDELAIEAKRLTAELGAIHKRHGRLVAAAEAHVDHAEKQFRLTEAKLAEAREAQRAAVCPLESRLNRVRGHLRSAAPPAIRAAIDMLDSEIAAIVRISPGDSMRFDSEAGRYVPSSAAEHNKARGERILRLYEVRRAIEAMAESPLTTSEIEAEIARLGREVANDDE